MATVEQIVSAVRGLSFEDYLELRLALDALEPDDWAAELWKSTAEWNASGKTDEDVDSAISRRRSLLRCGWNSSSDRSPPRAAVESGDLTAVHRHIDCPFTMGSFHFHP